ncbi:hypothetical protein AB0I37_19575 [Micromonospora purpureochromogenes]|uniref:hypothetical protein n=1 Tax=Micromonospora purpureochromogenes TaxID=47872 RepID=UPI0033E9A615
MRTRLAWMTARTSGKHARGTNIIPFSMHNIDEVLDELGLNLGPLAGPDSGCCPSTRAPIGGDATHDPAYHRDGEQVVGEPVRPVSGSPDRNGGPYVRHRREAP